MDCPRFVGAAAAGLLLLTSIGIIGLAESATPAAAAPPGTAMPLQEFVNDGAGGRLWNSYDQTFNADGPEIDGRPSPISYGSTVHVYTRSPTGDLVEYDNDGHYGRLWNAYDLTVATSGPTISGDPAGLNIGGGQVHAFAQASDGDLIEWANDGVGGRLWNSYDVTQIANGPTGGGDPFPILVGSTLEVFLRAADGDLVSYTDPTTTGEAWSITDLTNASDGPGVGGDPAAVVASGNLVHVFAGGTQGDLLEFVNDGGNNRTWNAYDLTESSGGPTLTGRPSAVVVSGLIDVFVRASNGQLTEFADSAADSQLWNTTVIGSSNMGGDPGAIVYGTTSVHVYAEGSGGNLTEFVNDNAHGQLWSTYDLTQAAAAPTVGGDPNPLVYGLTVHVYVGGPPPATPPGGVGLYGLEPGTQTSQAIEDNWPIIGDTGALGTQTAPYTGFNLSADLSTGQAIAASGRRITWLSFWTVSGPVASGAGGMACYTSDCYYSDGYSAGQYVADTIDSYSSSGLTLKPDWVILDPEGYPDNHSGLDSGPGATDATWSSFLSGWANGIASVDPRLHAGFYADQYEYNSFDLAAIQLPAFVAVAFPAPVNVLDTPTNVAGFISFGATCPAASEEQTLLDGPWGGTYNTLQFSGSQYCGP